MTRRVAVTGSHGFIGTNLCETLGARGDDIIRIARPFDPDRLVDALRGADAVVHLAGLVSALRDEDYQAANVDATRAVSAAAARSGVRMVHISSLAAAGPAAVSAPRSEDDPPVPITPYGRSKLEGERVVGATPGLRWTILRPTIVYGPGDRALLPLFRFAAGGIMPLVGRRTAAYMFVHVNDLVAVIDRAIDAGLHGEILFVAHERPATACALLDAIAAAVGRRALTLPVPDALLRAAARTGDLVGRLRGQRALIDSQRYRELDAEGFVCRVDRLRDRLGIPAGIALPEGLAQTAAWYRTEGWLR
ncbi:MAG TPA: NAD-dependent epimerase/dehydratase family protein [Vicinamibacterales bacterium]|nr:NAD-dependent epimerase/dehydratase family protein [Vicinamibacterales bacterium]